MSTSGFLAVKKNDKTIAVYNHSDSYPTWLGKQMFLLVRVADLTTLAEGIEKVVVVKETEKPSAEQLADLKARGFWQNVSTGDDWYAALRNAQGDLEKYVEAGYIPSFDPTSAINGDRSWLEWGYVIDLDERSLIVHQLNRERPSTSSAFPIDSVLKMTQDEINALMERLEYEEW